MMPVPTYHPSRDPTATPAAEPATATLALQGDYDNIVHNETLFLIECSATLEVKCVRVYPGSIMVDIEGEPEAVQTVQATIAESGLNLNSFVEMQPLSSSPTTEPTDSPTDAPSDSSNDPSSEANTTSDDSGTDMTIYIIIAAGAVVFLGVLACVMYSCNEDKDKGGKEIPDDTLIEFVDVSKEPTFTAGDVKRTPGLQVQSSDFEKASSPGEMIPAELETHTSEPPPPSEGLTTGGSTIQESAFFDKDS